jgi:hypothetical protein
MDKTTAQRLVRETFKAAFDKKRYRDFINELCNGFDEGKAQNMGVPDAFTPHVKSCQRLGTFESAGGELADVLIVHLTESYKLERTRTALRDFVAHKLKRQMPGEDPAYKEAGLVAFVAPDSQSWRFSFVRMEYETKRDTKTGKIKPEERLTPARRYSYIVGVDEECHTAQSRFLALLQDTTGKPTLSQIEEAFSVESVTKEFFAQYAALFASTQEALDAIVKKDAVLRAEFAAKNVSTVDFAKKLLGQIVFLYFIQKKGWLGVPNGGNWGDGPRNFLRKLVDAAIREKKCLFNDVLEPLFYDTLATDRGHEAWCKTFGCRIPFLNGGLFEPLAGYDWERTNITFSNTLFSNQERAPSGDIGSGILDVFDRYNFTVNEAEPLEKEVAIDPEMLGKVFENLIEENRRKGLGAFYTPREIVHYKCQVSLIQYLDTELNKDKKIIPREDIETFIYLGERISHYEAVDAKYPIKMPPTIGKHAKLIDEKLATITVCDPAVGSGAYPVGMMTELVRARCALTSYFNDVHERTPYHFKRHAIQSCLYGVDIDPGAVEIAKLRLWLSLVVDEEDVKQIKPLPNLNYKIVVGNSLVGLEETLFNQVQFRKLEELKPEYFDATDPKKKRNLKREIDELIHHLTNGAEIFDFEIYFSEVFHKYRGFHVVIGNPPFVGQSGNKDMFREVLKTSFGKRFHQRRMDYFYFFFHKALLLARQTGIVNFITTNYFLTATYADKVRQHIKESAAVLVLVNFEKAKLFHSAQGQHNAITMLVKNCSVNIDAEVAVTRRQGNLDGETLTAILRRKDAETSYARISNQQLFDGPLNYIRLVTDQNNNEQALQLMLTKIQRSGPPLVTIAEIVQGIVTGANQATERQIQEYGLKATAGEGIFVLSDVEVKRLHLNRVESAFIKPWYKNSDIDRWVTAHETAKRLIYIRADSELEESGIPTLLEHFERFKPQLVNRNVRTGSITVKQYDDFVRGRGDVPYVMIKSAFAAGKFYCVSYARDEHVFTGEKIVCPQFSPLNTFAFDDREWFAASDVYFIKKTRGSEIELKYLLGLLNSKLCYFWLYHRGQRKGDLLQLFKGPLSEIPVAKPGNKAGAVITLVDRILAEKRRDSVADTSVLEREIDELVNAIYGLTPEEALLMNGVAK